MARVHLLQQHTALLPREVRADGLAEGEQLDFIDVAAAIRVGEPEDLAQLCILLSGLYSYGLYSHGLGVPIWLWPASSSAITCTCAHPQVLRRCYGCMPSVSALGLYSGCVLLA